MDKNEKVIFSAIQPSGTITLGNYLGALKNWALLQNEYNCIFSLADLHTITVRQNSESFKKNSIQAYALLLACGINPNKSIFFIQSHVNAHAELAWILNCYTQFGELTRMTQFKDKSSIYSDNINAGLFTYPSLMVADILLYQTNLVPIGADQKQHLELSRNIAQRFNKIYGTTFRVPEPLICKKCANVMSLQNPKRKMSKSDPNINSWIAVLDTPDNIIKKFKKAITDSDSLIKYGEGKDAINNLIDIYSLATGKNYSQIEKEFESEGYGYFKLNVGEAIVEELRPIRERYEILIKDKAYLESCYKKAAQKAIEISRITLKDVKEKIGFITF